MRKLTSIFLVLLTILGIAWAIRWENGPTQSLNGAKVLHKKDRWTGQKWYAMYGKIGDEFKSGEEHPYLSKSEINRMSKLILISSKGIKKKEEINELEKQLVSAKEINESYSRGHAQYKQVFTQLKQDYLKKAKAPAIPFKSGNLWEDAIREMQYSEKRSQIDIKASEYALNYISNDLEVKERNWQKANETVNEIESKISNIKKSLPTWAQKEAEKELIKKAFIMKKMLSLTWLGIVLIITGAFLLLNFHYFKSKEKPINQ